MIGAKPQGVVDFLNNSMQGVRLFGRIHTGIRSFGAKPDTDVATVSRPNAQETTKPFENM